MGDFLESFVWSSMEHFKNNLKNNYFIFKQFIFFLITTSFSY
jgi:hypothetical protein